MAFIHSFFDESGKFKDHRVISFCGVVASAAALARFDDAWNTLLRNNQLEYFHTKHALRHNRSLSPIIRGGSISERNGALKPFLDCILDNLGLGIAIAIDVEGFSKWSPGAKQRVGGSDDPTYLAFIRAALILREYASRSDDRISLTCDDCEDTALNFYKLYRHFRKVDDVIREKFIALTFADDKYYPALQAADFIAAFVRLEAYRQFAGRPYDYRRLFDHLSTPGRAMKWSVMFANKETLVPLGPKLEKIPLYKAQAAK